MTSWMKYNLLFFIFLNTTSWAEPSTSKTIRSLDDTELRNITDHNHGDTKVEENKDHYSKDKQLRNEDSRQQKVINGLMLQKPNVLPPSK
ncbi:hypothetical protein L292_1131 [Acinetobacter junii CIP 107470 = MTCC 11364]|jgi:hypothetical protein|uniref:Uncharacterized protein n=1 Tax=Acinetobacter junii CIP 107470 = MTCC 11364 TaxID=1217666 RepID=S7XQH6_ACIJU|nr:MULTISPECIES: hypothetical protein [Acinetobacter]AZM39021.1 hypothetical protein EJP75_11000 [Acinetobacter baumannii]ENV50330.1 hypothetical protein F953_02244 [Acinetobacter junii CIP 107470 = MTCC 11364]EPR81429.1 hypothetical protein L292_1131 [Acinetobacter junii CIP 107470 = MTCC 11364]MCL5769455.1 hypothetical protein [Acinetobacter sp. ANC5681]MCU4590070.1 hypothetical protein [Acinetobacter ursingii]